MRGIFITASVALWLSLLLSLAVLQTEDASRQVEVKNLLATEKIAYTWNDVSEELPDVLDVKIEINEKKASFKDNLPATANFPEALGAFETFIKNHYAPKKLQFSFEPQPSSTPPRIHINPLGFYYKYPSWDKTSLEVNSSMQNFAFLQSLTVNLNITSHDFNEAFSGLCAGGDWDSYTTCTGGTTYCLSLNLNIEDRQGTTYQSTCTPLDLDYENIIVIDLINETSTTQLTLRFGALSNRLFSLERPQTTVNSTLELNFNTTAFEAELDLNLIVKDAETNRLKNGKTTP